MMLQCIYRAVEVGVSCFMLRRGTGARARSKRHHQGCTFLHDTDITFSLNTAACLFGTALRLQRLIPGYIHLLAAIQTHPQRALLDMTAMMDDKHLLLYLERGEMISLAAQPALIPSSAESKSLIHILRGDRRTSRFGSVSRLQ